MERRIRPRERMGRGYREVDWPRSSHSKGGPQFIDRIALKGPLVAADGAGGLFKAGGGARSAATASNEAWEEIS